MVVMELLSCVFVYWYWGRWAYTTRLPPRYTAVQSSLVDKKEKGRIDLFAEMWLAAQFQFGVHQFCHWLALLPEADDGSRTLITVTDSVAGGWATLMFCFLIPNAIIYGFRKQFFQLLTAGARDKQRLQDGAFIAALLVDEKGDMIEEARKIFRGVPFSKLSAGLLQSSTGTEEDYALSQPCELGSIDYFISHSWSDDGEEKFARLSVVAADFQREHGREPIFWLDKVCIDQVFTLRNEASSALFCLLLEFLSIEDTVICQDRLVTKRKENSSTHMSLCLSVVFRCADIDRSSVAVPACVCLLLRPAARARRHYLLHQTVVCLGIIRLLLHER
jgi:hypothetical protein